MEQAVWKMSDWVFFFFLSVAPAGWSRGWEGKTQLTAASWTRLARLASTPLATCDWVCACACVCFPFGTPNTHTQSVIYQFAQINRCGSYLMSSSGVNPPVAVCRSVSEWFHRVFLESFAWERQPLRSAPVSPAGVLTYSEWVSPWTPRHVSPGDNRHIRERVSKLKPRIHRSKCAWNKTMVESN